VSLFDASPSGGPDDGRLAATALKREEQAARRRLEEQARHELQRRGGPPPATETIVRAGDPASTILATAAAGEADLLVVGIGREGALGSVAQRVMRDSGRPVLAVPPPSRAESTE
jgi:nucleotide-binding universal stress UspA family protein